MKGPIPIFLRTIGYFPMKEEQSQLNAKPLVEKYLTWGNFSKVPQKRTKEACLLTHVDKNMDPRGTHLLIKNRPNMDHLKNRDPHSIFCLPKNCLIFAWYCHTRSNLGISALLEILQSCKLDHEVAWFCNGDQPPTHPPTHPPSWKSNFDAVQEAGIWWVS